MTTKRTQAEQFIRLIKSGPDFDVPMSQKSYSPQEAEKTYKTFVETWLLPGALKLIILFIPDFTSSDSAQPSSGPRGAGKDGE